MNMTIRTFKDMYNSLSKRGFEEFPDNFITGEAYDEWCKMNFIMQVDNKVDIDYEEILNTSTSFVIETEERKKGFYNINKKRFFNAMDSSYSINKIKNDPLLEVA